MIIVILTILLKKPKTNNNSSSKLCYAYICERIYKTGVYLPFTIAEKLNQTSY